MNMKTEKIVMMDSDEAASIQTVTGWVDRHGRFWGKDEHQARWCGATHRKCNNKPHEHPIHSTHGYCEECHRESRQAKFATVSAFLAKHYGGNYTGPGVGLDAPAHSITTVDHHAVVASHLVKLRGTCRDGQRTDVPMPTVTAGGLHIGNVETSLSVDGYDELRAQQTLAFLREYCNEDSDGLVTVDGIVHRIVDIGMRMLQPHELYRAQGFPDWYIIDRDYRGVKYAKDKQVARCGNAVPPPFAEALVRANLPDMCVSGRSEAA